MISQKIVQRELGRSGNVRFGDEDPAIIFTKFWENYENRFNKYDDEMREKVNSILTSIPKQVLSQLKCYESWLNYQKYQSRLFPRNNKEFFNKIKKSLKSEGSKELSFGMAEIIEYSGKLKEIGKIIYGYHRKMENLSSRTYYKWLELKPKLPKWLLGSKYYAGFAEYEGHRDDLIKDLLHISWKFEEAS